MAPDDGKARTWAALNGPLLILTVVTLLIVNLGLFLRMNQLQLRLIGALEGLQPAAAAAPGNHRPTSCNPLSMV